MLFTLSDTEHKYKNIMQKDDRISQFSQIMLQEKLLGFEDIFSS